jgi:DNA-binding CsgD family transcriptional regulator
VAAGVTGALRHVAEHTDLMADLLCPVLIGRGAETDALRSALAAARDGAGAVVFLTGEAGIGKSRLAAELATAADGDLQHYPVWADLARLCAAEPALADGWGRPRQWLEAAADVFARHGIEPLAVRCRRLLDGPRPSRWARLGITDRQADVLRLVAEGISNKEIAARLHLSPRTVEKHVENLLRITAAQSRTQLVAIAGPESD